MAIGSKQILDFVLKDLKADLGSKLQDGNSIIHCSAQFYEGFLPLLVLIKEYKQDVNQRDEQGGSPLHFAVTEGEHKNVELLIKHGADVNLQDEGLMSPLHQAVFRWCQEVAEPEFFDSPELYKEIAKELLFNGANRTLENEQGQTGLDLLEEYKETEDNQIDEDEYMLEKYWKFRGILIGGSDCALL